MSRVRGEAVNLATNYILKKIENYEFSAGDIVSDLELSKEFDMSRTPIREAIMSLIDSGILERTATKVVVKSITLTDITEILQVREAIEQKAASIIIEAAGLSAAQEKEFSEIHMELLQNVTSGNFSKNFQTDELFHRKLIEYSGNSRLLDIAERLSLQSQRLRWISTLTPSRYISTHNEHAAILEALFHKNAQKTDSAIREHYLYTLKNYQDILNMPQCQKIAREMRHMKV